jgi:hypothetical protein
MFNDPDKTARILICNNCLFQSTYGVADENMTEAETEEYLARYLKGTENGNIRITLGMFEGFHSCHVHVCELDEWGMPVDYDKCECPVADECECENYGFTYQACELCNGPGGDRTYVTIWW